MYILVIIFFTSCSNGNFLVYDLFGNEIVENNNRASQKTYNKELYFDRSKILREYEEVNVIAMNNYYYGNFYFDKTFMHLLNKKIY